MNRAALEDYRVAVQIRLKHRLQTGRAMGADLGDLIQILDALLAPEPVVRECCWHHHEGGTGASCQLGRGPWASPALAAAEVRERVQDAAPPASDAARVPDHLLGPPPPGVSSAFGRTRFSGDIPGLLVGVVPPREPGTYDAYDRIERADIPADISGLRPGVPHGSVSCQRCGRALTPPDAEWDRDAFAFRCLADCTPLANWSA